MTIEMASSAAPASLRNILQGPLSLFVGDVERVFAQELAARLNVELETRVEAVSHEATGRARTALAEQLNQAVRRFRQAPDAAQLAAILVEVTARFAAGVALLRVAGMTVSGEQIRGACPERAAEFQGWNIPLVSAPALAEAVKILEPITSIPSAAEVSPLLAGISSHVEPARAFICPIVSDRRVPALLYAWGDVETAAVELVAQVAGAVWAALPTPANLVRLGTRQSRTANWESLSSEEQALHLRAQRFAQVQVARMRLEEADAVQAGRRRQDLYALLRPHIDAARASFRKTFFETCPSMVDYLHLEFLHTLANNDPELLGENYPGPMV